ncbi:CAF17-like 4Fe-4S cluster assembly/insertion protein YgfZ [Thiomicrorhabdus chilensis]|uniref:CAF17-like 4Fe-4S cluster assembly/insertion protein YgfZ n=1 Tax=Thiomicrorhabdus chilensis TaxID=63656 RepID=UPI000407E1E8|nr:folate-binding protein YgfZ [Thiomicrorhabdus chilensis]
MTDLNETTQTSWQAFLTEQGAQLDEHGKIVTFGHAEVERYLIKHGPVLTSLNEQALLKVSGSDAFDFLQGQLTADLAEVTDQNAQLSSYCDPKGNVLAVFLIFKYQNDFYLSFEGSLQSAIQKRLSMFVLRSDVQVTDAHDHLVHIGYGGEFGDLDIQRRLNTKVKEVYETGLVEMEGMEQVCVVKVPGPYHKYDLFGPADQIQQAWLKLRDNCDFTNSQDWRLLNIAAGIPEITRANSGTLMAQFLNLDKLNAINFKKGCFPGQEIIARIHYRGKVTKRMLRLHLEEALSLSAGETLKLKDSAGKTHSFDVISANPDVLSGTRCLAVASLKPLESVEGNLMTESGKAAIIEPMPYSLTDE